MEIKINSKEEVLLNKILLNLAESGVMLNSYSERMAEMGEESEEVEFMDSIESEINKIVKKIKAVMPNYTTI